MKARKILLRIGIVFFALILMVGAFVGYRMLTAELTYSNLVDMQTLNEIADDLLAANVPKENVDLFKLQVESTNDFLGDFHSFHEGFVTIKKDGVKYDDYEGFKRFSELRVPYSDINCRVSVWNLAGDLINAEPWEGNAEVTFAYEISTLLEHPYVKMTEEQRLMFYSTYAPIPSNSFHFNKKTSELVIEAWKERGVIFKEDPKRTVINIFSYRPDKKTLEAPHAGILIERENDYIFVEKWNPTLPFQVSIFESRKDVERYLKYRMITSFLFDATIMENGELFKP